MDNQLPARKPLRMPNFDYNTPGAYFLTFCTHKRKYMLSRIVGTIYESPESQLTICGKVVEEIIKNIPDHLHVIIDQYVIMPNHIHLIAIIAEDYESPLRTRSILSKLVGYIKMNASKAIHQRYGDIPIWQRGYYDHAIRNHADYMALAEYIQTNPLRWERDKLYTEE